MRHIQLQVFVIDAQFGKLAVEAAIVQYGYQRMQVEQ